MRRIDSLLEIERAINGETTEQGLLYVVRSRRRSSPISRSGCVAAALLSSGNDTAKAINYLLNRWAASTRFLDDGRVCLSNNAAERALRGVTAGEGIGPSLDPTLAAAAPLLSIP